MTHSSKLARSTLSSLALLAAILVLAAGCVRTRDDSSRPAAAGALKAEFAGTPAATIVSADTTPSPTATYVAVTPTSTPPPPTATAASTPAPTAAVASSSSSTIAGGGGGAKNIIRVVNKQDGQLRMRGHVRLNRIPGPTAAPGNIAAAFSQCTGCSTFATALQIDLISKDANRITPENAAVAINIGCNGCTTVARAYQYVIQVDDPVRQTPEGVNELINRMNRELDAIQKDPSVTTPAQADARVRAVLAEFQSLAGYLMEQRADATEPTSPNAPSTAPEETQQ